MRSDKKYFYYNLLPGLIFVIALWVILVCNESFGLGGWWRYGVKPRRLDGLTGIVFMPLLHGGWDHLVSNTLPLFILTGMLFNFYRKVAWELLAWMVVMTGLWTWVIGREGSIHVGASGIIYALVSFLFISGVVRRDKASMVISLSVTFLYGSMIWGVLPFWEGNISWEGHLSGALSGISLAFFYRNVEKRTRFTVDEDLSLQEAKYGPEYWKQNNDSQGKVTFQYFYKPTEEAQDEDV